MWKTKDFLVKLFGAIGEGEAVAALGWDYVICLLSARVWAVSVGGAGFWEDLKVWEGVKI